MTTSAEKFQKAIELYDAANKQDPNQELDNGTEAPKELLYSHRMLDMINRYLPEADDVAKLSVAGQ